MKKAFTLAEVLITLGIVGVIAAMVLPTLITNVQWVVLTNKFKHSYAVISSAIELIKIQDEAAFDMCNYD